MDILGFVFGLSGFTFGMIGMSLGISASSRIDELKKKLNDAGILGEEMEPD